MTYSDPFLTVAAGHAGPGQRQTIETMPSSSNTASRHDPQAEPRQATPWSAVLARDEERRLERPTIARRLEAHQQAEAITRLAEDTTTALRALTAAGVDDADAAAHARAVVDALVAAGRLR